MCSKLPSSSSLQIGAPWQCQAIPYMLCVQYIANIHPCYLASSRLLCWGPQWSTCASSFPIFWQCWGIHFQHGKYVSKVCGSIFWFLHLHILLLVLKATHYTGKNKVMCGAGSRYFPQMFVRIQFLTDVTAKKETPFFKLKKKKK